MVGTPRIERDWEYFQYSAKTTLAQYPKTLVEAQGIEPSKTSRLQGDSAAHCCPHFDSRLPLNAANHTVIWRLDFGVGREF